MYSSAHTTPRAEKLHLMSAASSRSTNPPRALTVEEAHMLGYPPARLACDMENDIKDILLQCKDHIITSSSRHPDGSLSRLSLHFAVGAQKLYLCSDDNHRAFADTRLTLEVDGLRGRRWDDDVRSDLLSSLIEQEFGLFGEAKRTLESSQMPLDTSESGLYFKVFNGALVDRGSEENPPISVRLSLASELLHGDLRLHTLSIEGDNLGPREILRDLLREAVVGKTSVLLFKQLSSRSTAIGGTSLIHGPASWYQDLSNRPTLLRPCDTSVTLSWCLQTDVTISLADTYTTYLAGSCIGPQQLAQTLSCLRARDEMQNPPGTQGIALERSRSRSIGRRSFIASGVMMPLQLFGDTWGEQEETIQILPVRLNLTIEAFHPRSVSTVDE